MKQKDVLPFQYSNLACCIDQLKLFQMQCKIQNWTSSTLTRTKQKQSIEGGNWAAIQQLM